MAPVPGMSREQVVAVIEQHPLDRELLLDLGTPHRFAAILYDLHRWQLVPMISDQDEVTRGMEEARQARRSFMAEHIVDLQRPGEPIYAEADRSTFAAWIAAQPWKHGAPDLFSR